MLIPKPRELLARHLNLFKFILNKKKKKKKIGL